MTSGAALARTAAITAIGPPASLSPRYAGITCTRRPTRRAPSTFLIWELPPAPADSAGRESRTRQPNRRAGAKTFDLLRRPRLCGCLRCLAPAAALVAVALDLAGQIVRGLVDRADHAVRGFVRAEGYSLEVEGDLGNLRLRRVPRVAFLGQLDLGEGEFRDLLRDLLEALFDAPPKLVTDRHVAPLDLDAHAPSLDRIIPHF